MDPSPESNPYRPPNAPTEFSPDERVALTVMHPATKYSLAALVCLLAVVPVLESKPGGSSEISDLLGVALWVASVVLGLIALVVGLAGARLDPDDEAKTTAPASGVAGLLVALSSFLAPVCLLAM